MDVEIHKQILTSYLQQIDNCMLLTTFSYCCCCRGEENISVIVAPIYEGFKLSSLGTPEAAAQNFLDTIVAPQGADRTAKLVQSQQR